MFSQRHPYPRHSLYLKLSDFDRACLPGVWFEPVVSHAYYFPGRQHVPKSVQVILCYANNKALSYHLIATTKEIASYMTHLTLRMETSILNPNNDIS